MTVCSILKAFTVGTLIALPIYWVAGCQNGSASHRAETDAAVAPPPPLPKPVVARVKVEDLCKQYIADEASADETFKGRFIEVTDAVVVDKPGSPAAGVDAYFVVTSAIANKEATGARPLLRCFVRNEELKQYNELKPGETITFRGFCEGRSVGDPRTLLDLTRCTIAPAGAQ